MYYCPMGHHLYGGLPVRLASIACVAGDRGQILYSPHTNARYMVACRLNLEPEQLPSAFEAEERNSRDTPDVLHLVSGRTLLGKVRKRTDPLLQGGHPPLGL